MNELTESMKEYYQYLKSCCLGVEGEQVLGKLKVATHFEKSEPDGHNGAAVVETVEGEWFVFEEWQDYTGHGCQCDCQVSGPFATQQYAIQLGLSEEARRVLGLNQRENET